MRSDLPPHPPQAPGAGYALERELGRGGMATVYLARDLKHERAVAVKVLHPELAAVLGTERFLQEVRVTATLQHPHILGLIDSGVFGEDAGELRAPSKRPASARSARGATSTRSAPWCTRCSPASHRSQGRACRRSSRG